MEINSEEKVKCNSCEEMVEERNGKKNKKE
jgi:hypothetical protein